MILPILLSLFLKIHDGKSQDITVAYDVIESALEYYNSHSVLLIFDEIHNSSDLFKLLTLQKRLSSGNSMYYSSITTLSGFPNALEKYRQNLRETVVTWNPKESFPNALKEVSDKIEISAHKWFVTTSDMTSEAFNNITIPLNSEFTIAKGNPLSGYSLEEIYDVIPGMRLSNPLGRWSVKSQEFHLEASRDMFTRRKDFQGAPLKVASPMENNCGLFLFLIDRDMYLVCVNQNLWYKMEEMLNATTDLRVIPHLNNSTIQQEDVDFTLRPVHTTADSMDTRDFIWPTFNVQVVLAMSYITQKVKWETFILPFKLEMWIVVTSWIILWDFILSFFAFIKGTDNDKHSFFDFYSEFFFSTMFSFCSQGVLSPSKSCSTRIILLMMFVVPGVLFPGYSAVLTSFLTVQLDKQPFRNIEELSHDNEYKVGWLKTFDLEEYLNLKSKSLSEEQKNKLLKAVNELPTTDAQGLERMCNEKYSYVCIRAEEEQLVHTLPRSMVCTFTVVVIYYSSNLKVWKATKSDEMNPTFLQFKVEYFFSQKALYFSGVRRRMIQHMVKDFLKYDTITLEDKNEVFPIKLENIILPFVVLLLGVIASVILLFLEIIFFRFKSERLNKSTPLARKTRRTRHVQFAS